MTVRNIIMTVVLRTIKVIDVSTMKVMGPESQRKNVLN